MKQLTLQMCLAPKWTVEEEANRGTYRAAFASDLERILLAILRTWKDFRELLQLSKKSTPVPFEFRYSLISLKT
ncbi:unnamed protein product [Nezara viridula]|uniref:Uncharacterized protein n=1 Tax=Nezara viridula TaxID=85310 RepID=A0A9P0MW86_NEZVI|nr:unnamed protein product [Nezara viridula]